MENEKGKIFVLDHVIVHILCIGILVNRDIAELEISITSEVYETANQTK